MKTVVLLILSFVAIIAVNLLHGANRPPNSVTALAPPKTIDHIVLVVDENKPLSSILGNPKAPYINKIAGQGASAYNYHASVKNPYIALTSGADTKISNVCNPFISKCQANTNDITSEISESGRSWKMYAEGMPKACDFKDTKKYAVRHNPFMYYPKITNSADCVNHVVPFTQLESDLKTAAMPDYIFISPDLCNDMHNCSIEKGDSWLSKNIPKILSSQEFNNTNSLLILTWDEGSSKDSNVLTVFLGPAAKSGYVSRQYYSIYSLLRTVEYIWNLKPLSKHDKQATIMSDMLK